MQHRRIPVDGLKKGQSRQTRLALTARPRLHLTKGRGVGPDRSESANPGRQGRAHRTLTD